MLNNNNTVVQAVCCYSTIFILDNQLLVPRSLSSIAHSAAFHLALCVCMSSGAGSWRGGFVRGEVSSIRGRFGKWDGARRHVGVSGIGVPAAWHSDGSGDRWQEEDWRNCCILCWYSYDLWSVLGCGYVHRHCKPYCTITIAFIFQVIIVHVSGGKGGT